MVVSDRLFAAKEKEKNGEADKQSTVEAELIRGD